MILEDFRRDLGVTWSVSVERKPFNKILNNMLLGHETDVAYIRHPLKMEQSPCVEYTQHL